MPTNTEAYQTIRAIMNGAAVDSSGRTTQGWAALQPAVPFTFSGEEYDPPDQGNWVRVTQLGVDAEQIEFGIERRFRRAGLVRVQFWLVAGAGSGLSAQFADTVKSLYEGRTVAGVRFRATTAAIEIGADGPWYQYRCDTDFDYDELRPV